MNLPSWFERRPGQIEYSRRITEAIKNKRLALIEAPTGIGKSIGYLVPVIRLALTEKPHRVVVSTHTRALQEQIASKDAPLACELTGADLRVAVLKGKANYLCLRRMDMLAADLFVNSSPGFRAVWEWAKDGGAQVETAPDTSFGPLICVDDTCSPKACKYALRCPYQDALRTAQEANIVVVNHALYLSDGVRLAPSQWGVVPSHRVAVFDEGHHLEATAVSALTTSLNLSVLEATISRAQRYVGKVDVQASGALVQASGYASALTSAFAAVGKPQFFLTEVREADAGWVASASAGLSQLLGFCGERASELSKRMKDWRKPALESLALALAQYAQDCDAVFTETGNVVRHGEETNGRITLMVTPMNVAQVLKARIWPRMEAGIITSGTLSAGGLASFEYISTALGIEDPLTASVGSPFDYENRSVLYIPSIRPPRRADDAHILRLSNAVEQLILLTNGRTFVLCTSRYVYEGLYEALAGRIPFTCLRQGEAPASELVRRFVEDGNAVLFATSTFWEGVDVKGPALSSVIIDRIPFEVPTHPVYRARQKRAAEEGRDWFKEYALPTAIIRLRQGIGRAIRSNTDTGVLTILDDRIITADYGPRIIGALPNAPLVRVFDDARKGWERICRATQ